MAETSTDPPYRPRRKLFSFACFVLLGVVILLGLFFRAVYEAREAARRSECHGNMFFLTHALHVYHDVEGALPPAFAVDSAGNPLYSWRVILSPYIDQQPFYEAYDLSQGWDHPENLKRANEVDFRGFTCPSGANAEHRPRLTDYVAVVGPGTAFPGPEPVSFDDITDGLENTILLVEIAHSEIHWSEPRDLLLEEMSFTINHPTRPSISSPHPGGPGVVFADVRFHPSGNSQSPADHQRRRNHLARRSPHPRSFEPQKGPPPRPPLKPAKTAWLNL